MRFYNNRRQYTCGIDLHARSMYLCILDADGHIVLHRDLPTDPGVFLEAVAPCREDLIVAVECMFAWYWIADLCRAGGTGFVLGHALYMRFFRNICGLILARFGRGCAPAPGPRTPASGGPLWVSVWL